MMALTDSCMNDAFSHYSLIILHNCLMTFYILKTFLQKRYSKETIKILQDVPAKVFQIKFLNKTEQKPEPFH